MMGAIELIMKVTGEDGTSYTITVPSMMCSQPEDVQVIIEVDPTELEALMIEGNPPTSVIASLPQVFSLSINKARLLATDSSGELFTIVVNDGKEKVE